MNARAAVPHARLLWAAVLSAVLLCLGEGSSFASTLYDVSNNGTLTASVGPGAASNAGTAENDLTLLASPLTSGFNFSGVTGSTSQGQSAGGFFYTDYLFRVTPATADAVTITLNNASGVQNLQERLYQFPAAFAFDAAVPSGLIQAWGSTTSAGGASYSVIPSTDLSVAGLYVLEVRGTSAGNFGGDLALSPVPLPAPLGLMLGGLAVFAAVAGRRLRPAGQPA